MFRDRVVFILGAGASVAFKFPTGMELVQQILELKKDDVWNRLDVENCKDGVDLFGIDDRAFLVRFQKALCDSHCDSIDAFLSFPRHREFLGLGRILIAGLLIPLERHATIRGNQTVSGANGNWLRLIWNRCFGAARTVDEFVGNTRVTFVTYNYDRTVEHFIYTTDKNSLHNGSDDDEDMLVKFLRQNVIHMHGSIGTYFPLGGEFARKYSPRLTPKTVQMAASSITLATEFRNELERTNLRARLEEADRIVFLGFGYQLDNLQRLFDGFNCETVEVTGSTFAMTNMECKAAKERIAWISRIPNNKLDISTVCDLGCCDFLRQKFCFD